MTPFDHELPTRIVFGVDGIDRLGELCGQLGAGRVLVVSDPGIVAAGHVQRGLEALRRTGLDTCLFGEAHENPTTIDVDNGLAVARGFRPEVIVGLGGGSSMDCAKGINFLYTNGGQMRDYWGVDKAHSTMLPMVAVPTTAGTGSEMQSFALITDPQTHQKMACGDKRATCRIALLDPRLTLTQPRRVTSLSGIDALSHALETYVSKRRNAISVMYSREAWRLLAGSLRQVLQVPDDLAARSRMQLGAAFAGLAIENSMLGASHALANPLTATYGTAHGQAVGVMLPHVIRYNGQHVAAWYEELLDLLWETNGQDTAPRSVDGLADFVTQLIGAAGLATRLQDCGVSREHFAQLAESAARQWTGQFNPRQVDRDSLEQLYDHAF